MTRPLVGLDMFYYAILTGDDSSGTTYDAPVRVENVVSLTVNPNAQIQSFYADDAPREVFSQIGEVDVSIMTADLPPEDYAALIGASYDSGTGVVDYDTSAAAPEVAVGFRALKSNGDYRYVWLLKGKFGVPNMDHQTKEGSVNFQSQTINGKFMARTYDDMVYRRVDGDDTNAMAGLPSSWFVAPDLGVIPSPTALAVDSVAGIAATTTWTFDNAGQEISLSFTNGTYFKIYDVTAEDYVANVDVTRAPGDPLQVIATPDAALTAGDYIAIAESGIRATDGGLLVNTHYSPFTVA